MRILRELSRRRTSLTVIRDGLVVTDKRVAQVGQVAA